MSDALSDRFVARVERLNSEFECLLSKTASPIHHDWISQPRWPDPEKVDRRKLQFCPIRRSRTNEEKSIQ